MVLGGGAAAGQARIAAPNRLVTRSRQPFRKIILNGCAGYRTSSPLI
jgi:hypothetical protein